MSKVDTSKTYWDNEGKYQEQYNAAWKALIPMSGAADNGWPEALRCISRIGYDYYNNGFCNLWEGWEEVDEYGEEYMEYKINSFYEDMIYYLEHHIPRPMHKELTSFIQDAQGYGNWSDQAGIIDRIIDHIMEGIIKDGLIETQIQTA